MEGRKVEGREIGWEGLVGKMLGGRLGGRDAWWEIG